MKNLYSYLALIMRKKLSKKANKNKSSAYKKIF